MQAALVCKRQRGSVLLTRELPGAGCRCTSSDGILPLLKHASKRMIEVLCYAEDDVVRNENQEGGENTFVAYIQIFSENTATTLKALH